MNTILNGGGQNLSLVKEIEYLKELLKQIGTDVAKSGYVKIGRIVVVSTVIHVETAANLNDILLTGFPKPIQYIVSLNGLISESGAKVTLYVSIDGNICAWDLVNPCDIHVNGCYISAE